MEGHSCQLQHLAATEPPLKFPTSCWHAASTLYNKPTNPAFLGFCSHHGTTPKHQVPGFIDSTPLGQWLSRTDSEGSSGMVIVASHGSTPAWSSDRHRPPETQNLLRSFLRFVGSSEAGYPHKCSASTRASSAPWLQSRNKAKSLIIFYSCTNESHIAQSGLM